MSAWNYKYTSNEVVPPTNQKVGGIDFNQITKLLGVIWLIAKYI